MRERAADRFSLKLLRDHRATRSGGITREVDQRIDATMALCEERFEARRVH